MKIDRTLCFKFDRDFVDATIEFGDVKSVTHKPQIEDHYV